MHTFLFKKLKGVLAPIQEINKKSQIGQHSLLKKKKRGGANQETKKDTKKIIKVQQCKKSLEPIDQTCWKSG
jgi:hypothetical protein